MEAINLAIRHFLFCKNGALEKLQQRITVIFDSKFWGKRNIFRKNKADTFLCYYLITWLSGLGILSACLHLSQQWVEIIHNTGLLLRAGILQTPFLSYQHHLQFCLGFNPIQALTSFEAVRRLKGSTLYSQCKDDIPTSSKFLQQQCHWNSFN